MTEERLVKLPRTAMRSHAARLLMEQGGLCPLCGKPIDLKIKGEGVIDHDHDTGRIRGILHRSCNAAEGTLLWLLRHPHDSFLNYIQELDLTTENRRFINDCNGRPWFNIT